MNLHGLDFLKKKIAEATDFKEPFEYFLDNFGEHEEFLAVGKPVSNPVLEASIKAAVSQFLVRGREQRVDDILMIGVPRKKFIHGSCIISGRHGSFLYFEDIQLGLVTMLPMHPDDQTLFSRFSARELPPGWVPGKN